MSAKLKATDTEDQSSLVTGNEWVGDTGVSPNSESREVKIVTIVFHFPINQIFNPHFTLILR